jgi:Saxitoxin biosynthesis operon protein SxtJ
MLRLRQTTGLPMSSQTHETYNRDESSPGSSDRSFGLTLAVAFAFFGVIPLLRGKPVRVWCFAASAVFILLALAIPAVLHPLNRAWNRLGQLIGKITNPIITCLMFFAVFTPAAVILRLLGKDLLRLEFDRGATTYWINRTPAGPSPETMSNQF